MNAQGDLVDRVQVFQDEERILHIRHDLIRHCRRFQEILDVVQQYGEAVPADVGRQVLLTYSPVPKNFW